MPALRDEARGTQPRFSVNDPRWLLAKRAAQSSELIRSERLSRLLLYVCRMHLEGRDDEINEQRIGVDVFRRSPSFDSGSDTIVRTHATRLRQKLEHFFKEEGCTEPLHLEIPRGGYVPRFFPREEAPAEPALVTAPAVSQAAEVTVLPAAVVVAERRPWRGSGLVAAFFVGVAAALLFVGMAVHFGRGTDWARWMSSVDQSPAERRFWSGFFGEGVRTLVVTGDSGLVLFDTFGHREVNLPDYIASKYGWSGNGGTEDTWMKDLPTRRYTSVTDLNLAIRLSHLPQWEKQRADVVFARDLRPADASRSNLILIGSRIANPWVSLVEDSMNFILTPDESGHYFFLNRNPQKGESERYSPSHPGSGTNDASVYALICYRPENQGMRRVLLLSGLWQSGTEAAGNYVLGDRQFSDFLRRIMKSDGSIPSFELLVQVRSVAGNAFTSTIIASRVK